MQQAINAAEVNESPVIGHAADDTLADLTFRERGQSDLFALSPLDFGGLAVGQNDFAAVPIYFNDQVTNVSRFFASSEYFRQQALTEVGTAQRNLDAARGAWIDWRNSHIQSLSQGYDMNRRIEDLERHFGEPILEACGLTNVAPTGVLDAFGGDQGSYTPESCYRPAGVACASDTDANCYRGTMGEAALAIVAAQSDVRVATSSWDDAKNAYDTQTTYCMQFAKDQAAKTNLANKHAQTLGDLQTQRLWADSIVTVLGTAKECANLASTVSSYGGTCAGSVNETIAKIVSLNIQKNIDDENNHYQAEMTAFDAAEATKTCFHEADMKKIGIDTAREQIGRRLIEVQANLLKLQNLQRRVRELVSEGRAARERERGRKLPSVEFHYWLNEKIDTFRQQFGWAKHVAFLAAKGLEWDYQVSLADEKKRIIQATTPNQLTTALLSLGDVTLSKQINTRSPGKTEVGVYSLASDILKLGDRTGANGKNVVGRFRDLLTAPSAVIYDVSGRSLGRGIRFTFPESLVPGDRCAERLWRVMAAYVGDQVTLDGGKIGMRVAKRNTFSSRWCVGHGAPGTEQVGVTNGLSYFFGGHGTTPVTVGTAWNSASVDAVSSPAKADFANVDFHNGSSEELAGRGLFGDYIVYIPTTELARVNFSNLEDIFIRLDYEDIDNSQIGLKSSIVLKH